MGSIVFLLNGFGEGWERFDNIRYKQLAMIMHKIHNNLFPIVPEGDFYQHLKWDKFGYVPRPRTAYAKESLH